VFHHDVFFLKYRLGRKGYTNLTIQINCNVSSSSDGAEVEDVQL